jgi:hypothetical protein
VKQHVGSRTGTLRLKIFGGSGDVPSLHKFDYGDSPHFPTCLSKAGPTNWTFLVGRTLLGDLPLMYLQQTVNKERRTQ